MRDEELIEEIRKELRYRFEHNAANGRAIVSGLEALIEMKIVEALERVQEAIALRKQPKEQYWSVGDGGQRED